ncbi:Zinc knuckle CX2CX4HX4C [Sesbania bispinosa]|nr:Zinc knuckle CX2CX4HX4C [Sesbania bispinosa]
MTNNKEPGGGSKGYSFHDEPPIIVFDDEDIQEGLQDCKNIIVAKVFTEKTVHVNSLSNSLNSIWNALQGFKVVDLGEKLFQLFFHNVRDADRALKGNPWIFRHSWMVLRRWECGLNPRDMDFDSIPVWLQIWGLPVHCRTQQMGKKIGASMGRVLESNIYEVQGRGSYVRTLVEIDAKNPLLRGVNAGSRKDRVFWVDFQYEKLPQFCYGCGIVGHDEDGCNGGTGRQEEERNRGPWMRAVQSGRQVKVSNPQQNHDKPSMSPAQEERRKKMAQDLLHKLSSLTMQTTSTPENKEADPQKETP